MNNNYFAFIDESGNSNQERFFGLGLLLINDEIGDFYDAIKPYYEQILTTSRFQKSERIKNLVELGEIGQISQIADSNKDFELKFKYIGFANNLIYKELIKKYFSFKNIRFCSLIIDRSSLNEDKKFDPWDVYIHRAAMLLSNNIKNIKPCSVCVLADDLSRPNKIHKSFENSLKDSISQLLNKNGIEASIFGVTRLESHASLMTQMVDILLGCVMYDFKKEAGLISTTLAARQGIISNTVHEILKTETLAQSQTFHSPNYFSVWKFKK